jgi:hypothetical protein
MRGHFVVVCLELRLHLGERVAQLLEFAAPLFQFRGLGLQFEGSKIEFFLFRDQLTQLVFDFSLGGLKGLLAFSQFRFGGNDFGLKVLQSGCLISQSASLTLDGSFMFEKLFARQGQGDLLFLQLFFLLVQGRSMGFVISHVAVEFLDGAMELVAFFLEAFAFEGDLFTGNAGGLNHGLRQRPHLSGIGRGAEEFCFQRHGYGHHAIILNSADAARRGGPLNRAGERRLTKSRVRYGLLEPPRLFAQS